MDKPQTPDHTPTPESDYVLAAELAKALAALDAGLKWMDGEFSDSDFDANSMLAEVNAIMFNAAYNARKLLAARPTPADDAERREGIARKLCEQHGGDPDAVATDEHDCWDGPLWTAFLKDADAIMALPISRTTEARLRELVAEALPGVWTDFLDANPDDLTSPENLPDHALMTGTQFEEWALEAFVRAALEAERGS